MARTGFYNENEYRDYPFRTQVEPRELLADGESVSSATPLLDLPHETIVDAGFIMGVNSGYDAAVDWVYLHAIRRVGGYLLFEFRTTAPGAADESVCFLRLEDCIEFFQDWAYSTEGCRLSSSSAALFVAAAAPPDAPLIGPPDGDPPPLPAYTAEDVFFPFDVDPCNPIDPYTGSSLDVPSSCYSLTPSVSVSAQPSNPCDNSSGYGMDHPCWWDAIVDPCDPFGPLGDRRELPSSCSSSSSLSYGSIGCETTAIASMSSSSAAEDASQSLSLPSVFCDPSADPDGLQCGGPGCHTSKWEGFLVTGLFSDILDQLGDGESMTFPPGLWVVEPARVQSLNNSLVRSVNLANKPRLRVTAPDGCPSASAAQTTAIVAAECLQGDLRVKEGYNCDIRQDAPNNGLIINAIVGAGEGEPCEEVPLYDGESPPDGSPFLTGGPACGELIRTVNGKSGPTLRITGGDGVDVFDSPLDPHTLFIDASLRNFALCLQTEPCVIGSDSSGYITLD